MVTICLSQYCVKAFGQQVDEHLAPCHFLINYAKVKVTVCHSSINCQELTAEKCVTLIKKKQPSSTKAT